MVVQLPQVVAEMDCEVKQEICCSESAVSYRERIYRFERFLSDAIECRVQLCDRRHYLRRERVSRQIACGEFRIAVANVAAPAENRADEIAEIPGNVERKIATRICDPRRDPPYTLIFRIRGDLTLYGMQIAKDHDA